MENEKIIASSEEAKDYFNKPNFWNVHKKLLIFVVSLFVIVAVETILGLTMGGQAVLLPWSFISDQVFGMKWLNYLVSKLIYGIFGTYANTSWQYQAEASAIFFIFDMIKIIILLCSLIFLVSYIQSYFPPEKSRKILGKYHGLGANTVGALLGTVTPFCSCSSIPIFIGFLRAGLSSGVTFSFLISSPLVDLGSLIVLIGFFGWPIALAYVAVGLILAVIGGYIIEKTGVGKNVEDFVLAKSGTINIDSPELTKHDRLIYARDQMKDTFKRVLPYILIGVGIGCVIHNFVPATWIENLLGAHNWYGVPLATMVGVPLYADIFGTIPVAESLFLKGAGLGTVLAFMMSVTALSLPSLIMLRRVVKPKLLFWFIFIVVVGIVIIGYLFNLIG